MFRLLCGVDCVTLAGVCVLILVWHLDFSVYGVYFWWFLSWYFGYSDWGWWFLGGLFWLPITFDVGCYSTGDVVDCYFVLTWLDFTCLVVLGLRVLGLFFVCLCLFVVLLFGLVEGGVVGLVILGFRVYVLSCLGICCVCGFGLF